MSAIILALIEAFHDTWATMHNGSLMSNLLLVIQAPKGECMEIYTAYSFHYIGLHILY